jgi:hypothetical protein
MFIKLSAPSTLTSEDAISIGKNWELLKQRRYSKQAGNTVEKEKIVIEVDDVTVLNEYDHFFI